MNRFQPPTPHSTRTIDSRVAACARVSRNECVTFCVAPARVGIRQVSRVRVDVAARARGATRTLAWIIGTIAGIEWTSPTLARSFQTAPELRVTSCIAIPTHETSPPALRANVSALRVTLDGRALAFGSIDGPATWGALEIKGRGNEPFLASFDREGVLATARRHAFTALIPANAAQDEFFCMSGGNRFCVLEATGTTRDVTVTAATDTNGFFVHSMRRLASGGHTLGGTTSVNVARHTVLGSAITPRERCGEYPIFGRLDEDGSARWVLTGYATPAGTTSCGFAVTHAGVDSAGNIGFLARLNSAELGFLGDTQSIKSIADFACVIGRVTKDGAVSWMLHPARPGVDGPESAAVGTATFTNLFVDDDGMNYLVGFAAGKCRIGSQLIDTGVDQRQWRKRVIAAAFDPTGKLRWLREISRTGHLTVRNAAADARGNMLVALEIKERAEIAGASFESRGKEDVVLIALDRDGEIRGTLHLGGEERDQVHAVAAGPMGEYWIAGMKGAQTPIGLRELAGSIYVARIELPTSTR